ncbi:MAG: Eco57I restriction-modification methylase domain-containing protein, partial [Desulfuromonadaceae bacterium]|nr:Eco57I restriction-modification methylase domain-containing protein [Desulfuromonadaceae bacterium]
IEQAQTKLYTDILSDRIKELTAKLSRYENAGKQEVQTSFLEGSYQSEIELTSREQEQKISELKFQISQIDHEIHQLGKHNLPFIWKIDFPEIFMERGGFDIVIGNPPYLKSGKIRDPLDKMNPAKYKRLLQEMTESDFPEVLKTENINRRSDLYTFFYVRGMRIANYNGHVVFICSNSWLDVDYGYWLQSFVVSQRRLHYVFNNQVQRSFKRADVNTIISVIGPSTPKKMDNTIIRFVSFKLPMEECVFTENLVLIEEAKDALEYNDIRINPISIRQIIANDDYYREEQHQASLSNSFYGTKLGSLYLTAPNLYWEIVKRNKSILHPLLEFFDYKRGLTTNCVRFFYVNKDNNEFQIEDEYLEPIITTSQNIKGLVFNNDKYLFHCHKHKSQLLSTNAIQYIESWEKSNKMNQSLDAKMELWYSATHQKASFLLFRFWDKRFFTPAPTTAMIASDNFFIGYNLKHDLPAILALLNSTFYFWQIEIMGRKNQGQGVLNTYRPDYEFIKLPDLSKFDVEHLKSAYLPLCSRDVLDFKSELKQPDKMILDNLVFDALNLTQSERNELIDSYIGLVSMRLTKASSLER